MAAAEDKNLRYGGAQWFKTAKNPGFHWLTHSLAHALLTSLARSTALIPLLAHLLTHSLTHGKEDFSYEMNVLILYSFNPLWSGASSRKREPLLLLAALWSKIEKKTPNK